MEKTWIDIWQLRLTFSTTPSWTPFWNFCQTCLAQHVHEIDVQSWCLLMLFIGKEYNESISNSDKLKQNYFGHHIGRRFGFLFKLKIQTKLLWPQFWEPFWICVQISVSQHVQEIDLQLLMLMLMLIIIMRLDSLHFHG